jgi:4-amino-4-deoxy-L-arabinose transferase-like glycosyltransferase
LTIALFRRHAPALGLLFVVALIARLAWIAFVHPDPIEGWFGDDATGRRFDDTVWYRGAAHFIAQGDGYVNPFTGTPTAGWPPGYPFFLGAVFKLFGEGLTQTYVANALLASVTVVLIYCIGLILFDARTAIFGAAAAAVWPGQVYFTSLTLSEPLFTLLFTLGVLLLLLVPRARRWRGPLVITFGLVIGLTALTRGQGLLLLPLAIVAWRLSGMRWRPSILWGILAAFVIGVTLAPWVARNERELGSPVIIATNLGPNLWIGHNEGASGGMSIDAPEPPQPERGDLTQGEFEVEADRLALRKGLSYMLTHPADELRLSGIKIRAMYESDATALDWNSGYTGGYFHSDSIELALRRLANAFWFGALILAGFGLVASRVRLNGALAVLPMLVLAWTATHLLFFGDPRFHYPITFAFALLAARGAVVLYEALRRPQPSLGGRYAEA